MLASNRDSLCTSDAAQDILISIVYIINNWGNPKQLHKFIKITASSLLMIPCKSPP
jgi:hypothetical protein